MNGGRTVISEPAKCYTSLMSLLMGVFGGTFDPPHNGHLVLAAEARSHLGLDRLLWVLTPDPPHKKIQPITPLIHRLAMVRLALQDTPGFELSTVDIDRPAPHYALDTVKIIAGQYPGMDLVYVMGGDSLRDLPAWHRPTDLVNAVHFLGVMRRPGDAVDLPALERLIPGVTAKVRFLDGSLINIAAHDIRSRASDGRPFSQFLPPLVYDYIIEHGLYQTARSRVGV
jgi:nicotinate-nucleotide adenylyltransferase